MSELANTVGPCLCAEAKDYPKTPTGDSLTIHAECPKHGYLIYPTKMILTGQLAERLVHAVERVADALEGINECVDSVSDSLSAVSDSLSAFVAPFKTFKNFLTRRRG